MTVTIKRAEVADMRPAAAMEARAWRESYQGIVGPSIFDDLDTGVNGVASHWADLIGLGQEIWVVLDGSEVVGVCHAGPARDDDAPQATELTMLYLLEPYKGTGVATDLVAQALGDRPAYLWVLRGNVRAIAFYEKEGFVLDGAEREMPDMAGAVEQRMVRAATSRRTEGE